MAPPVAPATVDPSSLNRRQASAAASTPHNHHMRLLLAPTMGWFTRYSCSLALLVTWLLLFYYAYFHPSHVDNHTHLIVESRITNHRRQQRQVWDPGIAGEGPKATSDYEYKYFEVGTADESVDAECHFHCLSLHRRHTGTSYSQWADPWCTTRPLSALGIATAESSTNLLKPS